MNEETKTDFDLMVKILCEQAEHKPHCPNSTLQNGKMNLIGWRNDWLGGHSIGWYNYPLIKDEKYIEQASYLEERTVKLAHLYKEYLLELCPDVCRMM